MQPIGKTTLVCTRKVSILLRSVRYFDLNEQTTKPYVNTWKYGKAAPLFRNAVSEKVERLVADECRSLACVLLAMESICMEVVLPESCKL